MTDTEALALADELYRATTSLLTLVDAVPAHIPDYRKRRGAAMQRLEKARMAYRKERGLGVGAGVPAILPREELP